MAQQGALYALSQVPIPTIKKIKKIDFSLDFFGIIMYTYVKLKMINSNK